ncbi:MAG: DUF4382 domain-containing protein, partial [Conexivisphaera sp.]
MKTLEIALIAIVVAAVVAGGVYYANVMRAPTAAPPTSAPTAYAVALTDPPIVPNGTTLLMINYSGVAVHTEEQGWIANASATGSVNLLALQNLSVVIANVRVPANSTVNEVRLYMSNATIMVNGTTYPVMLPSGVLKIPITNASRAAPGTLVDLQPHVFEAYVGDKPVFIMAPAAVAVPLNYTAPPGTISHVPKHLRDELERAGRADVVISPVALTVNGNVTTLRITLTNEGKEPVQILGVALKGPWALSAPPIMIQKKDFSARIVVEGAWANMCVVFFAHGTQLVPALQMASEHVHAKWFLPPGAKAKEFKVEWEGNESEMKEWSHEINESSPLNVTVMGPGGLFNFSGGVPPIGQGRGPSNGSSGMFQGGMGSSGGMTGNSGFGFGMTQGVAFADEDEGFGLRGYTLAPGQSATFVYSGVITLGPHLE